jgi:hypothetical protein
MNNNLEQERRFYEGDEMEIPDLEKSVEEKRMDACLLRYAGMTEHMIMLDIDIWTKLKFEILTYQFYDVYDYEDERDEEEYRYLCFKDKYC